MKLDIREIGFWIVLILAMSLLLWNVFGNSPSEFLALVGIIFVVVIKLWFVSDRQIITDMRIKEGFGKMKGNMDLVKNDIGLIKGDMDLIKNKLKI
jgi:hypothetical protein